MLNLDVLKEFILEKRRHHSNLPIEILKLLEDKYELLANPIETEDSTIYILKQTK